MLLKTVLADGQTEQTLLTELKKRAAEANTAISAAAAQIIAEIKEEGITAVQRASLAFDGQEARMVGPAEIDRAYTQTDEKVIRALEKAAHNIRLYHEKMLVKSWRWQPEDGIVLGQEVRGLSKVGIYVPGGTAAYPSSVLMNAIPAKVAGVEELVMVTPPRENINTAVLAAAKIAGIDTVIAVGGVQAVAALAYGAGFIPKVDKIVGPGNAYVAAAKRLVFGEVDIDMIAGPSEVLVLADATAVPAYVAADLLSQAEHDPLAGVVLVTPNAALASAVAAEIEAQAATLSRKDIITSSLCHFGAAIVTPDLTAAVKIANQVAPEHLEVITEDPQVLLPQLKNAGAIFLGAYTPEPLGDYLAGPSHVLPTGGTARFFSPLSTDSFLTKTSIITYDREHLQREAGDIILLAEEEGLDAHANSIRRRFS